jgi:predicted nuclease with TOPRIM domain
MLGLLVVGCGRKEELNSLRGENKRLSEENSRLSQQVESFRKEQENNRQGGSAQGEKSFQGRFTVVGPANPGTFVDLIFQNNGVATFVLGGVRYTKAFERSGSVITIKKLGISDVIVEIIDENKIKIDDDYYKRLP